MIKLFRDAIAKAKEPKKRLIETDPVMNNFMPKLSQKVSKLIIKK